LIYLVNDFKEATVFWKLRKNSITIPLELHEKIKRSCDLLNQVQSEVVNIRHLKRPRTKSGPSTAAYSRRFIFGT